MELVEVVRLEDLREILEREYILIKKDDEIILIPILGEEEILSRLQKIPKKELESAVEEAIKFVRGRNR